MKKALRAVIVEDNPNDAELVRSQLQTEYPTLDARIVTSEHELRTAMDTFAPHLVLSDFSMPQFSGLKALELAREHNRDIPFIFVSGTISQEHAIAAIKQGATDYVLKDNMRRLGTVVARALDEALERNVLRQTENELKATQDRLQSILDSLQEVVWSVSMPDERVIFINEATRSVFGRAPEEYLANDKLWLQMVHPDDVSMVHEHWQQIDAQSDYSLEYRIFRPDGSIAWVHDRARPHLNADGNISRIDGITSDITERKLQETHILRLSRIHRCISAVNTAIAQTHDKDALVVECCRILISEGNFRLAYIGDVTPAGKVTPRACAGPAEDYVSLRFKGQAGPDPHRDAVMHQIYEHGYFICNDIAADMRMPRRTEALARGLGSFAVLRIPMRTSSMVIVAMYAPDPGYFNHEERNLLVDLATDIGNALDQVSQAAELEYLATHDTLTGLLNKDGLSPLVMQMLSIAREENRLLAWILVNVSRFSQINESLGRDVGDTLLCQISERLRASLGGGKCHVARLDADRFVIIAPPFKHARNVARFVENELLPLFVEPFVVHDANLHLRVQVGIALAPHDGEEVNSLLVNATTAARRSSAGPEHYLFYEPEMNASVSERLLLENKMRQALIQQQFVLHYQPKIDLVSGSIVGAEALIRWNDPDSGLVAPYKFIPLLEETGLIIDVGAWVMRQALADLATLHASDHSRLDLAVNVSRLQLQHAAFIHEVAALRSSYTTEEHSLSIEITESTIMGDIEETIASLQAIRDMNISIAIDDFGTGYSSLSVISKLPINIIKIDRSFIVNMTKTPKDMAMVATIVELAHALDLRVVAEGVDSEEQLKSLRLMRCDEIQGYLYSPPVPFEQFRTMLEQQRKGINIVPEER